MQPEYAGRACERGVHDAWLDDGHAILDVDREDARELVESKEHRIAAGERAGGEPGAGAARHEGAAGGGDRAHDLHELIARAREHGQPRETAMRGQGVGRVYLQFRSARDHPALADDRGQRGGERRLIGKRGGGGHVGNL